MRYSLAGKTDRGAVRDHNEDAVGWHCDAAGAWALAVVADGMGGYEGGEVASALAVDLYGELVRQHLVSVDLASADVSEVAHLLRAAGASVDRRIKLEQQRQPALAQMGTTLVAGLVWRQYLSVIHVGDSRCYRWRRGTNGDDGGEMTLLTRDHTYVEEMMARGDLSRDDARVHPYRHVLTRALGGKDAFQFTVTSHEVSPGDRYLFCTDGLYNTLSAAVLKETLASNPEPEYAASALLQMAKPRAGDNVSVVVLYCN